MNDPAADNSHQVAAIQSRQEIDTLYTPLDEALEQIKERRSDRRLREMVTSFFCEHPPDFLGSDPRAFLFRPIITPNREFELFSSKILSTGLSPLCLEYASDILSTRNPEKYRLCHPVFEVRPNHFRGLRIMSFGQSDGRRLRDLNLTSGICLPDFHHALLRQAAPEINGSLHDFSSWFATVCRQEYYYLHYLVLFIQNGILFENFLADDEEEQRFVHERVFPSFIRAAEIFGMRPLIVPLLPLAIEREESWRCHDGKLYGLALKYMRERS